MSLTPVTLLSSPFPPEPSKYENPFPVSVEPGPLAPFGTATAVPPGETTKSGDEGTPLPAPYVVKLIHSIKK
jgi:hypothetical protein